MIKSKSEEIFKDNNFKKYNVKEININDYSKYQFKEKTEVLKVAENQGYSNFISYKDKLILWSQRKNAKVSEFDITENKLKELFVSKKPVLMIKDSNGHLIEIEGSSTINCYDFETASLKELYYGSGIQDG